jgi:hypothetical protein
LNSHRIENNTRVASPLNNELIVKKEESASVPIIKTDSLKERPNGSKIIILHPSVGEVIDLNEKVKYDLFPFWSNENYSSARFIQRIDSSIVLIGKMNDGKILLHEYTGQQFLNTQKNHFSGESIVTDHVIENVNLRDYHVQYNKAVKYHDLAVLFFIGAFLTLGISLLLAVPFAFTAKKNAKLALKQELDASHTEEKIKLKNMITVLNRLMIGFGITLLIVYLIGHFVAQTF